MDEFIFFTLRYLCVVSLRIRAIIYVKRDFHLIIIFFMFLKNGSALQQYRFAPMFDRI